MAENNTIKLPGVVSLLDNNESDWRLIIFLNLLTSFADSNQLIGENCQELSFTAAVPEHDQFLRLSSSILLEEPQKQLLGDVLHVLDDLLIAL